MVVMSDYTGIPEVNGILGRGAGGARYNIHCRCIDLGKNTPPRLVIYRQKCCTSLKLRFMLTESLFPK